MLRRVIGEDVKLEVNLASGLGKIKADKGQIEQVLMNLVVNARDAMLKGGNLFIQTSNIELTEPRDFKDFSILAGKYVLLQVKDTGHGMSEEIQERIFEPFFTTKEVGKGTGLGLATVYGIIKQSEGYIIVESELEKGTTFNIYLPTSEEKIKSADGEPSDLTLMRGVETILLVEDDKPVREMTQEILETSGYKVLVPADCNEAIDFCRKYEGTIHLLLTDVVMPELNGRELAERLLLIRPKMKVLYMSGYSDDEIGAHGVLEENLKLIQKPYTIKTITRGVREMLDSYEEN
jgi:CheY-like chemotaxis protein